MDDMQLLIEAGCGREIAEHCAVVATIAQAIAERAAVPVDRDLVRRGAMLHDLGRAKTHGVGHALAGVELGRALGLSGELLNIIERHIGAGITAAEAGRLGLPRRDYLPLTVAEKIVSYADNLVTGTRIMDYPEALERFRRILGPEHEGVELFIRQHRELQGWMR